MKVLLLLLSITLIVLLVLRLFSPNPITVESVNIRAPSQQDTDIDTSSDKALMDYILSSMGEIPFNDIEQSVNQVHADTSSELANQDTFSRYSDYKKQLSALRINWQQLGFDELERLHLAILALQQQFFNPQQIATLFTDENQLRQLTIDKLRLAQSQLSPNEQQQQWQILLQQQSGYIRQSEHNRQLLSQLTQAQQLSEQERYLNRQQLVGSAGAERLAALDQQYTKFTATFNTYLQQRDEILASNHLSESDQDKAISELRHHSFEQKQWRRVKALERMHAQRNNQKD